MTYLCAMAPHHLPAGEAGLPAIDTVEAVQIAADWISPRQQALSAFATRAHLGRDLLAQVVSEVRATMAEHHGAHAQDYGLRLLLVHLQGLCESRGIDHLDDDPYWCWCQPYSAPTPASRAA